MFFVSLVRKLGLIATAGATWGTMAVAGEKRMRDAAAMTCASSPAAETVARVLDGWHLAKAYVTGHPGCEVFVGCGDSMLPLYRDRTVLVVRTSAIRDLQPGMTVVFTGDQGRLVALQ